LAAPNDEGWSCPYGQSRFGVVTEVWGEEQEEWTVGGWAKRERISAGDKGRKIDIRK
jgi:hypothetical protein